VNALDLLFPLPEKCGFCERRAYKNGMCKLCVKEVIAIRGSICERCGRPMDISTLCADCYRRKETYFVSNRSAALYNSKMKDMISLYKFRGQESLVHPFVLLLEQAYRQYYSRTSFDYITFVPIHEKRLKERGFNQAEQLAFYFSMRTKIPVISLLRRIQHTEKQSKKHRDDRLQTLSDSFQIKPHSCTTKRVLLIDDVYTTGSTINECAKILAREGIEVYSLTVAR
jgi:competence protein ComFC